MHDFFLALIFLAVIIFTLPGLDIIRRHALTLNTRKMNRPMRLSKNFTLQEFACKCGCGNAYVDPKLVELLQTIREHFDQPVTITSGYRCKAHNKAIGGAPLSYHLEGKAADIKVRDTDPAEVFNILEPLKIGLGIYDGWVHIDVRGHRARWDKRKRPKF